MALAQGHALSRGAQDRPDERRPARQPRRLAPGWMARGAAMAHELEHRPEARAPSRRFAGRPGAAPSVAPGDPQVQVGPRTSRPARAVLTGLSEGIAVAARRAPGSATYAPLSLKGRSDNPRGVIVSRALWSAGTRAHAHVALPRNARERCSSLKARALYITQLCTPAPGDPGLLLRRGIVGRPAAHEGPGTRLAACTRPAARLAPGPCRAKPSRPSADDQRRPPQPRAGARRAP